MSLLATGRTDIGLQPEGSDLFVPLGIGVILPSFHEVGNMPVEIERLNNSHNDGAMLRDVGFNIFGGIPALPIDRYNQSGQDF